MQNILDIQEYRIWVVLRVLWQHEQAQREAGVEEPVPPFQRELFPAGESTPFEVEWERLGLPGEQYSLKHLSQFHRAVTSLRACGLMVAPEPLQDGGGAQRKWTHKLTPYALTDEGRVMAERLGDDWRQWPRVAEVCDE